MGLSGLLIIVNGETMAHTWSASTHWALSYSLLRKTENVFPDLEATWGRVILIGLTIMVIVMMVRIVMMVKENKNRYIWITLTISKQRKGGGVGEWTRICWQIMVELNYILRHNSRRRFVNLVFLVIRNCRTESFRNWHKYHGSQSLLSALTL